jgi:hypothetical protein
MKSKVVILCLFCSVLWFGGCNQATKTLFIDVASDHRELTVTTADELLASISEDLREREATMSPQQLELTRNLIDHLKVMKQQSIVIEKYAFNKADKDALAAVLRNRITSK